MAQQLDETTASKLIDDLDDHFASKRRYLMPPYAPTGMRKWSKRSQILDTDGFQKIADEMRLYLNLSPSVHVSLRGGISDANADSGDILAGTHRSENPWSNEILLYIRPNCLTIQLAAVLAHEMTHAFLEHNGVRDSDVDRNELLTEAGAVYLGMGELLHRGYVQSSWSEKARISTPWTNTPFGPMPGVWHEEDGTRRHTESVGYVNANSIGILMDLSSRCAGCHYTDVTDIDTNPTSWSTRQRTMPFLKRFANRQNQVNDRESARLMEKIEDVQRLYNRVQTKFESSSFVETLPHIVGPEWTEVGKTYALCASGRLSLNLIEMRARLSNLKSNTRWNAREAHVLEADAAEKAESLRKVLDQIDK